jgi:hypothetical protein
MKKMYCKICNKEIHPKRVQLGYNDTCVDHSSTSRYTGVISASGKSDYEINVIRNKEQAQHIVSLSNIY